MPPKKYPMVYKCTVWWREGLALTPVPSNAYGTFQERRTIDEAMRDKVALKLTSMKGSEPCGRFFVNVIEYPEGFPPDTCSSELYFTMGGD